MKNVIWPLCPDCTTRRLGPRDMSAEALDSGATEEIILVTPCPDHVQRATVKPLHPSAEGARDNDDA